jgi:hypothetical protein
MSLEALIADAKKRAKAPKKAPRSRSNAADAYYRTKEELLAMKLEACVPVSVHLRVTYQACECGAALQSVNTWPLVKRVSPSLTHFEAVESQNPGDLSKYNDLPRFLEVRKVDVPWCEDCFANATYVEVKDD